MLDKLLFTLLIALFGGVVFLAYAVYQDAKAWPAYRDAHNCATTGRWRDETILLPIMSGNTTVLVPSTTIEREWTCDTGAVWR